MTDILEDIGKTGGNILDGTGSLSLIRSGHPEVVLIINRRFVN